MIIIVTAFVFCTSSSSQVTEEWVKHFNGVSNAQDFPTGIAVDNSGNVYITGISIGVGSTVNPWDIVTIKYNSTGEEVWVRTFGLDNRREEANDIKVDNVGNVYITGYAVNDFEGSDFLTIKYDANGDTVWVRKYSGPVGNSTGTAIEVDTITGIVYVTGTSKGILSFDDIDYITIAYEPNGEQFWIARYDGPGISVNATRAMTFRPGEVLVTGRSKERNASYPHILTIKYAAGSGDTLWTRRYNTPANFLDDPKSITVDQSGNVYVTGIGSSGSQPTDRDYLTIKYSPDGEELWAAVYNNVTTDEAYSVAIDNSGNVYVTGMSAGFGADFATVKYNSSGVEQWVKRYHGGPPFSNNSDAASAITIDEMSNVYVTGASVLGGVSSNPADMLTIKYSSDGDSLWAARYNSPGNGGAGGGFISLDNFGNIYVTGTSIGIGTASDITTIKYSQQVTSTENNTTNIPDDYILYQNYPNPFNPVTNIKFSIPKESYVTLKIYNLLGETIASFINQVLPAGLNEFQFDASTFVSSMYIYKLEADDFISVKKMVYLK